MARRARTIVQGTPRHAAQRENRREPVFLELSDEAAYLGLTSPQLRRYGVAAGLTV